VWNRLSSGSYFSRCRSSWWRYPKGRRCSSVRGPTVADRIAQTVVAGELEKIVDPIFDDDSYGYRPGRSAHDALTACRGRCWSSIGSLTWMSKPFSTLLIIS
jgi:RNA-directed DNA polymerase